VLELSGVHPRGDDDDGDQASQSARSRPRGSYADSDYGAEPVEHRAPDRRPKLAVGDLYLVVGQIQDPNTPITAAVDLALANWRFNAQVDETRQVSIRDAIIDRLIMAATHARSRGELRPLVKALHGLGVMTADMPERDLNGGPAITIQAWIKDLGEPLPEDAPAVLVRDDAAISAMNNEQA